MSKAKWRLFEFHCVFLNLFDTNKNEIFLWYDRSNTFYLSFYLNMEHIITIHTCLATWRSIWPAATAFTAFWAYAPLQYKSRLLLRSEFLWWPVRASENQAQFLKQHFNYIWFPKSYYFYIIFKILKSFLKLTISVVWFWPPKKKKYILISMYFFQISQNRRKTLFSNFMIRYF